MLHKLFLIICFVFFSTSWAALAQSAAEFRQRGMNAGERGNHQEAIQHFTTAISLESANPLNYFLRATARTQAFLYEPAIDDYGLALNLQANDVQTLINRGILHIKVGNYVSAIADFDRVVSLQPNNALAFFMRGEAKYNAIKGVYTPRKAYSFFDIVGDYSQCLALDNRFALAFQQRGAARIDSAYSSAKLLNNSETGSICEDWFRAFDTGLMSASNWIRTHCGSNASDALLQKLQQLVRAKQSNQRPIEVMSLLNQLIDTQRFDTEVVNEALEERIAIKISNKDFAGALEDAEILLKANPQGGATTAKAYYLRGTCRAGLRQFDRALLDFDQAIFSGYQTSWIYYERGNVQFELRNESLACLDWKESESRGDQRATDKLKIYCKSGGLFRGN